LFFLGFFLFVFYFFFFFFFECLANLIMTDTLEYWLEIIYLFIFFVHFCGNPGSKVARGVGDSIPRPSDLQPDAMTIRPRRPLPFEKTTSVKV